MVLDKDKIKFLQIILAVTHTAHITVGL